MGAAKRTKKNKVRVSAKNDKRYEISQEQFSLTPFQILREDGKVVGKVPSLSSQQLKEIYGFMVLARIFDDAALKLQRQGRLGTYGSVRGQEASQVGSAYCLNKEDWLVPSFRENASCITRGMPMKCLFQYWGGDERGHAQRESMTTLPLSIPIATQLIHGVGLAMAINYRDEKKAVLACAGDGGTSEGDFHEALNFAGVFKAPVVFLIQNNQWAISVPRKKQTASHTLAQKALAYGFNGVQVDGNDILAVYSVVSQALEKARNGGGPTLIECVTYRIGDHTTADDAKRYRTQTEIDAWIKKDPIERLKKYLLAKKIWDAKQEAALLEEMSAKVSAAVKAYEEEPPADPKDVFAYTYATMTPQLLEQYQSLVGYVEQKKDSNILEKIEGGFP
ncbi:pyruvate dehydrogenase (acetyl-transferring) E1 component subunit alpha [Candidatus Woesearchaeota archaeon]|nr:pyruvate dehydrogenase (acetyl-transferring) E1 component subunit alpha [Candidatus Woesearchaeota archaeon]